MSAAGRPSQLERTRRAVDKAVNRARATGAELSDDTSIEQLEQAADALQAKLVELRDPTDMARVGTAIATLHAALHRIRLEARKKLAGLELDEDEAAAQMLAWLEAHGRLPS